MFPNFGSILLLGKRLPFYDIEEYDVVTQSRPGLVPIAVESDCKKEHINFTHIPAYPMWHVHQQKEAMIVDDFLNAFDTDYHSV